ncbi:MAG: DUF1926 domain-containing protein, partial [Candidatus Omnitrophica bacterium]|nr:DUF1926 domain-containing protein [Candidatus Omnitrophota bacterium]
CRLADLEAKQITSSENLSSAKKYLYMGQFNDAYWHGIFGGLYLSHLRCGVYENLIKAENLIEEREKSKEKVIQCDFDKDGRNELIVSTKRMRLYFRPEEGATISEWDDKPRCFNLTNTIARRFEHYHRRLKEKVMQQSFEKDSHGEGIKSIHEHNVVKGSDLDRVLFYDKYPRYSLRDYLLDTKTNLEDFYEGRFTEVANSANSSYEFADKTAGNKKVLEFSRKEIIDLCLVKITKIVTVENNLISVEYCLENFGIKKIDFIFGTEFNLSLYDSELCEAANEEKKVSNFVINDLWKDIRLEYSINPLARVWTFPVETISDSELGIEKMYQELCVFFNWKVSLDQNGQFRANLGVKLS